MLKFVWLTVEAQEAQQAGEYFDTTVALTVGQRDFLQALCRNRLQGLRGPPSNAELASMLCLALPTVRFYLKALYAKFELDLVPKTRRKGELIERAVNELSRPGRSGRRTSLSLRRSSSTQRCVQRSQRTRESRSSG
jgi:hypothetical protein